MKLNDYSLSVLFDSVNTLVGAWVVFFIGVFGGVGLTVFVAYPGFPDEWYSYIYLPLLFIPYAMFMLWGLLLIPLYIIVFYGLAWGEWNRLLCGSVLALATSAIILLSDSDFIFSESGSMIRCIIVEGFLVALLVVSAIFEQSKHHPQKDKPLDPFAGSRDT